MDKRVREREKEKNKLPETKTVAAKETERDTDIQRKDRETESEEDKDYHTTTSGDVKFYVSKLGNTKHSHSGFQVPLLKRSHSFTLSIYLPTYLSPSLYYICVYIYCRVPRCSAFAVSKVHRWTILLYLKSCFQSSSSCRGDDFCHPPQIIFRIVS